MEVNIHHAKTNLSKLIAAAESGEEVIIARNGKPTVKLVLVTKPLRGSGIGKLWMADDAFSSVADLEIEHMFDASSKARLPRPLGRLKGLIPVPSDEDWSSTAQPATLTTDGDL
jgi:prevent-host-death family protein